MIQTASVWLLLARMGFMSSTRLPRAKSPPGWRMSQASADGHTNNGLDGGSRTCFLVVNNAFQFHFHSAWLELNTPTPLCEYGMAPNQLTRRRVLAASGTALIATAGVFYGSERAQAVDVSVQELDIADQTASSPTAPEQLTLTITGDWAVDANVVPNKLTLIPRARVPSSPNGWSEFDSWQSELESKDASGTFELQRNLLTVLALRDLFPERAGESASRTVEVELLAIVSDGEQRIGEATVTETFQLTAEHVEAMAEIGIDASGSVRAE